MKSFIAIVLAFVPAFLKRKLTTPIHLAFSYDEEVGCIGVRRLIAQFDAMPVRPALCIVGEPTLMQVVRGHKGKLDCRCSVRGLESHSALTHRGVNAVEIAAEIIACLRRMRRRIEEKGPFEEGYDPPHTTVHTGVVRGGTQLNIVPRDCVFDFEFRCLPSEDPRVLFEEIKRFAECHLLPGMRAVSGETGHPLGDALGFARPRHRRGGRPLRAWSSSSPAPTARARSPSAPRAASSRLPKYRPSSAAPARSSRPTSPTSG